MKETIKDDIKEVINEEIELFEPDFEFSEDLQACQCLCGFSSGSGNGSGHGGRSAG